MRIKKNKKKLNLLHIYSVNSKKNQKNNSKTIFNKTKRSNYCINIKKTRKRKNYYSYCKTYARYIKKLKGFRNNIIYSKKYIKELKLVLGNYKEFIKSTTAKRRVISNKMKQLFSVENLSRIFENPEQIEYSLKNLNSILKTERKNIVSKIDTLLQKVPTRSNCSSFIKSFELVLCSFNDILLEKYDIKLDEDVSKKIKKIESLTLFTCIISATISNMVKKHSVIDNYSYKLTVASTHFKKSLKNVLYHYIMYLLLDKTKNQNEHSEKLSDQKIYFDNVSRFDYLVAILQEIAKKYLFTNTSNVAWNKDDSKNAHLDYIISKKLEDYVPFVEHLPEIIRPLGWIKKDKGKNISLIKPVENGRSEADMSYDCIKALEVSQHKKMVININAIKIFEILGEIPYELFVKININPITPTSQFENILKLIKESERVYKIPYKIKKKL